jgi:hypothetical protein
MLVVAAAIVHIRHFQATVAPEESTQNLKKERNQNEFGTDLSSCLGW